jgi:hypothetical protein
MTARVSRRKTETQYFTFADKVILLLPKNNETARYKG